MLAEWARSIPALPPRLERIGAGIHRKAWRFAGEMEEVSRALEAARLPPLKEVGAMGRLTVNRYVCARGEVLLALKLSCSGSPLPGEFMNSVNAPFVSSSEVLGLVALPLPTGPSVSSTV